jgi:hypothetical protein
MAAFQNPFPGMNPFLQVNWSNAHVRLLAYISDALSTELPMDLSVRAEERVAVDAPGERAREYRADVAVREDWTGGFPRLWRPEEDAEGGGILVAEPEIVPQSLETERWLEIRDDHGVLITVIELLSPHNKSASGREDYRRKQQDFLRGGVNLVEIDLLRGGSHVVAVPAEQLSERHGLHSMICVSRVRGAHRYEVYRPPFRERLPAFRVPLRMTDPDLPLDLQPLIDRCYETGRYWQLSDPARLDPPLPEEEVGWMRERLGA